MPFSAVVADPLAGWVRGQLVDAWVAEHQTAHGAFDLATFTRDNPMSHGWI